jgi:uncharacterized protein (TIGR02453 family)
MLVMGARRGTEARSADSPEFRDPNGFAGFPQAGFRLLQELKRNNDREWFRTRKQAYKETVDAPMQALVAAVGRNCRSKGLPLFPKEKNPVMRVYRDIRFSADKTPFKTHVAAELRRSFSGSQPMLYLHFAPDKSFVAAGVWQPDRTLLHAWRAAIASKPEEIETVAASLKRKKLQLEEEDSLSSMPRGFANFAETREAPFLKLTSFVVTRTIEQKDCATPKLVDKVVTFALDAKPLLELGWRVEQTVPKNFSE